jgi:hypothetical protein
MSSELSIAEFAFLARRAGLPLTQAQVETLYPAYGYIAAMCERLRTPRGREAEPAHIFVFDPAILPEGV